MLGAQGNLYMFRPYDPTNRLRDPAMGDDTVPDPSVYVVSMTQGFLEAVRNVYCVGRYTPNRVESAATTNISHIGGGTTTLTCGFDIHRSGRMTISGARGWIKIQLRLHHPTTISVHRSGVLLRAIGTKQIDRGYTHELMEVSDCLLAGQIQSATMPLANTARVVRVLESCLK